MLVPGSITGSEEDMEMLSLRIISVMFVPRSITDSEEDMEKGEPGAQTETMHSVRQSDCRENPRMPVVVRESFLNNAG